MAAWGCGSDGDDPETRQPTAGDVDALVTLVAPASVDLDALPASAKLVVLWAPSSDFADNDAKRSEIGYVADASFDSERKLSLRLSDVAIPASSQLGLVHCTRPDPTTCTTPDECPCEDGASQVMRGQLWIVDADGVQVGDQWRDEEDANGELIILDESDATVSLLLAAIADGGADGGELLNVLQAGDFGIGYDYIEGGELTPGLWINDLSNPEAPGGGAGLVQSDFKIWILSRD